jgi:hypothetical protein
MTGTESLTAVLDMLAACREHAPVISLAVASSEGLGWHRLRR